MTPSEVVEGLEGKVNDDGSDEATKYEAFTRLVLKGCVGWLVG